MTLLRYHTLIHLGCGARPPVETYRKSADHVWLIDADESVISKLEEEWTEVPEVHCHQALVDVEERKATFHVYNLSWANGLTPVSPELKRLYPGLACKSTNDQPTKDIRSLVKDVIRAPELRNLLILDVGEQGQRLLDALNESGLLNEFVDVVFIPLGRGNQSLSIPPALTDVSLPEGIASSLPSYARSLTLHPLVVENQQLKKEIIERTRQRDEFKQRLNAHSRDQEAAGAKLAQLEEALTIAEHEIEDLKTRLNWRTRERDERAEELKHSQQAQVDVETQNGELKKRLAVANKESYTDAEKVKQLEHEKTSLAQARDDLKEELQRVIQQRDANGQALEDTKQNASQEIQQIKQEQGYRKQLIDQEMQKAESQLQLIKDLLLRDKVL